MTTIELSDRFDLITDRVGSPYFTTAEKENFFNTAQFSIIDDILYPGKRPGAKDNDIFDFSKDRTFEQGIGSLFRTATLTATGSAVNSFTFSQINTALGATGAVGTAGTVYKVVNFLVQDNAATGTTTYNSAKHVRSLKSGTALYGKLRTFNAFVSAGRSAIYTIGSYSSGTTGTTSLSRIEFYPNAAASGSTYLVEVVINPRPINISTFVNPEIDVMFHNELLFRSLTLAGISSRDAQLAQASQQQEIAQ